MLKNAIKELKKKLCEITPSSCILSLKGSNLWSTVFDVEAKKERLKILEKNSESLDFWRNKIVALEQQRETAQIKDSINLFNQLKEEVNDLSELAKYVASDDEEKDLSEKLKLAEFNVNQQIQKLFLTGKHDSRPAIMTIQSGAGGRDAEDWTAMLLRMYQKYCEQKGWLCKILSQNFTEGGGPEGRIGVKEAVLAVKGEMAYGLLKRETGAHRLVRLSPFSAKQLRHTSFAQVEVIPQISDKEYDINIKPDDLKLETFHSAGHGGQNVNKRETAVRLTHLPTGLIASSQIERTQIMNKKIAMNFLLAKLAALREVQRKQEVQDEKSRMSNETGGNKKRTADFGQQIRSYVLHPYKLVKDHRTGYETGKAEAVLNGDLDNFIEAGMKI